MSLLILHDDALRSEGDGFTLRISLPWIRSLPLACLRNVSVAVDDEETDDLLVRLGDREIAPDELTVEEHWWFIQDRVTLVSHRRLAPGTHRVEVGFHLLIPYLPGGPDSPLALPFHHERESILDARADGGDASLDAA